MGTPGKWLLRLRICATRGGPAGLGRGVVRALIFNGTAHLGVLLLLGVSPPGRFHPVFNTLLSFLFSSLLFVTARAGNGYRGVHELLSGTRVVRARQTRPELAKRRRTEIDPKVELSRPHGLPGRVGPFAIRGALRWGEDVNILEGEDATLVRSVWIVRRPASAPAWPEARHAVDRVARPRWVAGGVEGGWRWDAVIAPSGRPLAECVSPRAPLPWRETRSILRTLAEELAAACEDGTLPERLTPDQVWLRPDGQVELLDVPRELSTDRLEDDPGQTPPRRALGLLRAAAVWMLEGTPRPLDPPRSIRAVMPRSASAALDRLMGLAPLPPSLPEFLDEMRELEGERPELGPGQRFISMISFVFMIMFGIFLTVAVPMLSVILMSGLGTSFDFNPDPFDWDNTVVLSLFAITGLALSLWSFFTRGGVLRHLLEAEFVGLDGRPASRLRCALRVAMFWGPFLLLNALDVWVESRPGISDTGKIGMAVVFLFFVLIYAAHGLFFRGRLLQDRLAGTVLVPK